MKDNMDIIVQFAVQWGAIIGEARAEGNASLVSYLNDYDSEELLAMFTEWANELTASSCDDTVDFFNQKYALFLVGVS